MTRRNWLRSFAAASIAFITVTLRRVNGQTPVSRLEGFLTDAQGKGLKGFIVEIGGPKGFVNHTETQGTGYYSLDTPTSGAYTVIFRNHATNGDYKLGVRQLTGGRDQKLSLTIDISLSIAGIYSKAQAVESICFLAISGAMEAAAFKRILPDNVVENFLGSQRIDVKEVAAPDTAKMALNEKIDSVARICALAEKLG